jgi:hypothetical protein
MGGFSLARVTGFEPAELLQFALILEISPTLQRRRTPMIRKLGTPRKVRTFDLRFRRTALYPLSYRSNFVNNLHQSNYL